MAVFEALQGFTGTVELGAVAGALTDARSSVGVLRGYDVTWI